MSSRGVRMTVARPQFRELAPFQFYDFQLDRLIVGNPELERTRIRTPTRATSGTSARSISSRSASSQELRQAHELQIGRTRRSLASSTPTRQAHGAGWRRASP